MDNPQPAINNPQHLSARKNEPNPVLRVPTINRFTFRRFAGHFHLHLVNTAQNIYLLTFKTTHIYHNESLQFN